MSIAEELDRWQRLYATVPDELHYAQAELHRRLAESVPEPIDARILHGDYRIGNMQFAGPSWAPSSTGRSGRSATPATTWPGS